MNKTLLCCVEHMKDVTNLNHSVDGTLSLLRYEETFQLHWAPLKKDSTKNITSIFSFNEEITENIWEYGKPFIIDCPKTSTLIFTDNPFTLSISRVDKKGMRNFLVAEDEYIAVYLLVEKLLLNGICVPSLLDKYCLEFYISGHRGTYQFAPSHIQLQIKPYTNLETFWQTVIAYFEQLLIHLDASGTLPLDPAFPINSAARSVHERVVKRITDYTCKLPKYGEMTKDVFDSLFDSTGKIKDPEDFNLRILHGTVSREILTQVIPFATGLYPYDSTSEDRERINKEIEFNFKNLEEQVDLMTPEQIAKNEKITLAFRVINHDVTRTDRGMDIFKDENKPGLQVLTKLLMMYDLYNPPIAYLQGMNDLFVPIILAYIPKVDKEGNPINEDGSPFDYKAQLPMIFAIFDSILRKTGQISLLEDVPTHCRGKADAVHEILTKLSPLAAIWMRRNNLQGLLWCYTDFVLMFKRSFEDIWPVWLRFCTCPHPKSFLVCFVAALLIASFDQLATLPEVSIPEMMNAFPRILSTLDPFALGDIALWVDEQCPPPPEDSQKEQNNAFAPREFFRPQWIE